MPLSLTGSCCQCEVSNGGTTSRNHGNVVGKGLSGRCMSAGMSLKILAGTWPTCLSLPLGCHDVSFSVLSQPSTG